MNHPLAHIAVTPNSIIDIDKKSLLYSISLKIEKMISQKEMCFIGRGYLRTGTKKSEIYMNSVWEKKSENFIFCHYSVKSSGFHIDDFYQRKNDDVIYNSSLEIANIKLSQFTIIDPLAYFFLLKTPFLSKTVAEPVYLLVGSKLRWTTLVAVDSSIEVHVDSKKKVVLTDMGRCLEIKIPQLKVRLEANYQ